MVKNENKHILIVSQYFYPEQFRINDIALELIKKGFKITVLTGIPNYPEGKFYKGYNRFKKRKETWNGINIIRIPIFSRGKNKIKLILNYYSYVFQGKLWNVFHKLHIDLVFCFGTSPLIQASVAKAISKKCKVPFYLYVQDLWPESLEIAGGIKNKFVLNHYSTLMTKIYDSCKTVFVTSPSFLNTLKSRTKSKIVYLPQYAEDCYKPVNYKKIEEIMDTDKLKIIFTGNIGKAQGLDVLIDVAKNVDNVIFVIVGEGRDKANFISKMQDVKDKFIIIGRRAPDEIPYLLKACDIAFISFMNNALFNQTIPAKLQTYMACGMPIIASASGECERIIKTADCGYCTQSGNIDELINIIKNIKKEDLKIKGENSLKYSKQHFNKENIINLLVNEIINS